MFNKSILGLSEDDDPPRGIYDQVIRNNLITLNTSLRRGAQKLIYVSLRQGLESTVHPRQESEK